jgi:hypothetical protein
VEDWKRLAGTLADHRIACTCIMLKQPITCLKLGVSIEGKFWLRKYAQ